MKPICPSQPVIILAPNGAYLKTLCIIYEKGNYAQAIDSCEQHGMKLLMIENTNTQSQLNSTLVSAWPKGRGIIFWIDGVKDLTDNEWYYYSSGKKTPASTNLIWLRGAATDPGCLSTWGFDAVSFKVAGQNCSDPSIFGVICEYREKASKAVEVCKFSREMFLMSCHKF